MDRRLGILHAFQQYFSHFSLWKGGNERLCIHCSRVEMVMAKDMKLA